METLNDIEERIDALSEYFIQNNNQVLPEAFVEVKKAISELKDHQINKAEDVYSIVFDKRNRAFQIYGTEKYAELKELQHDIFSYFSKEIDE